MRLTFAPETMTLNGERNATNDGESTAVQDAAELRSVILNHPRTLGIPLRAYEDLRRRISTSREAIMNEISERVVNDLTKRLATINARNNDERATLRTRIIQLETRLRFTIHDLRFTISFEYSASSSHLILHPEPISPDPTNQNHG